MIISVDDSGSPGLKPGRGVTSYFAIAAICFNNNTDAERAKLKIQSLKTRLSWKNNREFKFRKANAEIKTKFFEAIKNQKFTISVVLLEKSQLNQKEFYKSPSKLYNTTILKALQGLGVDLINAYIYIDGESGSNYRKRVKTFFRKNLPPGAIKELTYEDSVNNPLIQLADMVVGAIRYILSNKKDADIYYGLIRHHITTFTKTI